MTKNINWLFPNLFLFEDFTRAVDQLCNDYSINNPLKYVYGIIRCNWAYNYDSYMKFQEKSFIKNVFSFYGEKNITPILNFSRLTVEKEDLTDSFSNFLLDLCAEINGEIIVASDILFDYIKNKYPELKLISSVNKPIYKFQKQDNYNAEEELKYYCELSEKFDMTVIRPEFIKNIGTISEHKEQFIIPVNSACINNCQYFDECNNVLNTDFECPKEMSKNPLSANEYYNNLTILTKQQIEKLNDDGFVNFMLKDNKQYLTFLYPFFIDCLFGDNEKIFVISDTIREIIRSYWENNEMVNLILPEIQRQYFSFPIKNLSDFNKA